MVWQLSILAKLLIRYHISAFCIGPKLSNSLEFRAAAAADGVPALVAGEAFVRSYFPFDMKQKTISSFVIVMILISTCFEMTIK